MPEMRKLKFLLFWDASAKLLLILIWDGTIDEVVWLEEGLMLLTLQTSGSWTDQCC